MSAQTMRRLVKLAYAKREKLNAEANTLPLNGNSKKKHIQRGKTMTNVRVQRGTSTEQKVAHRLSVTMNQQKQAAETLHIRSFSLPKEKTPQIADDQQLQQQQTPSSPNDNQQLQQQLQQQQQQQYQGQQSPSIENNNLEPKHGQHPTITINIVNVDDNKKTINNLPPSTMNNLQDNNNNNNNNGQNNLEVSGKFKHMASASDTHTINSEFSETVYTENTEYETRTNDVDSQYGYTNLKPNSKNQYKGRGGGSLMSVGSASSMTMSSYDSSHKKSPNILPPALETVAEPSKDNLNTMKYADEQFEANETGGNNNNNNNNNININTNQSHISQQSVVQGMQPPQINMNDDDDDDDDIDYNSNLSSSNDNKHKSRNSIDLQHELQMEYENTNNSSSIWSCLLCGCCSSSPSSPDMNKVELVSNESNNDLMINNNNNNNRPSSGYDHTKLDKIKDDDEDNEILQLDSDDWRTFKSAGSRMRRPTQYTTVTNNEDSTVNVDDVRMWEDPFGKGASGRVFKGLYVPLCQVMALKVTSRLDNDNVKQILGEFKQQQEVLPDCDELMRIHGWYRNLAKNEIAVALEYMDMGSVYDSCFNTNTHNKSAISMEEQLKTGHKQIIIDKLTYDQLRFIARQSLLGLHALHSNSPPLIHRDIKPQNILLSSYGSVKIADFGLLIELKNGVCTDSKGTSKYFSPERIQGSFDTHADIWSLGITLIEIYKQELISAEELDWFKIVEDGIDIDDFLPATTPTEFADFLKQCLQHQSENRPSAKQLLSHQFITRKWGNPLEKNQTNNNLKNIQIQFSKEEGNQKLLDRILSWLEEWILIDADNNAKLFLEGDSEYLKQCVYNLSKYSGLPPKYIDRYIADLYREYTDQF